MQNGRHFCSFAHTTDLGEDPILRYHSSADVVIKSLRFEILFLNWVVSARFVSGWSRKHKEVTWLLCAPPFCWFLFGEGLERCVVLVNHCQGATLNPPVKRRVLPVDSTGSAMCSPRCPYRECLALNAEQWKLNRSSNYRHTEVTGYSFGDASINSVLVFVFAGCEYLVL